MASIPNTDGPAGAKAAAQAAAHPPETADAGAVDHLARLSVASAHERLDGHHARISALEHNAHPAQDADADDSATD